MSISSEINRIASEVDTQADLIGQIKNALAGKVAGGGGGGSVGTCTLHIHFKPLNDDGGETDYIYTNLHLATVVKNGEVDVASPSDYIEPIMNDTTMTISDVQCNSMFIIECYASISDIKITHSDNCILTDALQWYAPYYVFIINANDGEDVHITMEAEPWL